MCVFACMADVSLEVRGHLVRVSSVHLPCGFGGQVGGRTLIVSFGD